MVSHHLPRFSFDSPEQSPAWQALQRLAAAPIATIRQLRAPVTNSPNPWPERDGALQFSAAGIRLDARNQALGYDHWQALLALTETQQIFSWATAQRRGLAVNTTEGRCALHALLRADSSDMPEDLGAAFVDNHNGSPTHLPIAIQVFTERERMLTAAQSIRAGEWKGFRQTPFTDVVNIGIGGSDLGPRMAMQALVGRTDTDTPFSPRVHFLSNPDAWSVYERLASLDPATTLFVLQSKSFTTPETQRIAQTAREWLLAAGCPAASLMAHWAVVTARTDLATAAGFPGERVFPIWPWVGGRTSVWSSIGLPLAVAIGPHAFRAFLAGGRAMDSHFWSAPAEKNMPLAMALMALWNRHFLGCPSQAVAVYASPLAGFVPFLQQLEMESIGKRTHLSGEKAEVATGAVVWGGLGIDGQHAYFQLLHQGQHRVPVDFIAVEDDPCPLPQAQTHQEMVHANLKAQAQALADGRTASETAAALARAGLTPDEIHQLTPHRTFAGNVPNSVLWLSQRDPFHLGALVALYEHKVFCQAMLCQIQPFDQWGVELGKSLLRS